MAFDFYSIIIYPLIYILPAYVANGTPVMFGGGDDPIDFKKRISGSRIFGDNKTIRGAISGIIAALAIGIIEYPFLNYMLAIAFLLGVGTIFGDLFGSFIKRRMKLKPGKSVPLLDQYGFFVFALVFAYPLGHLPSLYGLIFLTVLTGILHPAMNMLAHSLKLKSVPW